MHPTKQWIDQKLHRKQATLHVERTVTSEFKRHTGGRILYASVTLELAPAKEFSIEFSVEPSELDYRSGIEDAIFSELLTHYTVPILGVSVRVLAVIADEIGSSYATFRQATSDAIRQAFQQPSGQQNIAWP
jgi:hypothetical protein